MFKFLSSAGEKALARELVERLIKDIPPTLIDTRDKVLSVNKVTRLLEKTFQSAAQFQKESGGGFYKRAVLANSFRWELKGAGYPEDFIAIAVEGLVVELSKAGRAQSSKPQ